MEIMTEMWIWELVSPSGLRFRIEIHDDVSERARDTMLTFVTSGSAIAGIDGGPKLERPPYMSLPLPRPNTLEGTLVSVLQGKVMSVSEAAQAVLKAGYSTRSLKFDQLVGVTIGQSAFIKRVDRGKYTAIDFALLPNAGRRPEITQQAHDLSCPHGSID